MASEVLSVLNPTSSLVQGSQALTTTIVSPDGGKNLPQVGKTAAAAVSLPVAAALQPVASPDAEVAATQQAQALQQPSPVQAAKAAPAANAAADTFSLQSKLAQLNKSLNDSGLPAQFRASADNAHIEELNPVTGDVIAQYSAAEFPALARSVGISGATVNSLV
jgi:cell division septation protein DedD